MPDSHDPTARTRRLRARAFRGSSSIPGMNERGFTLVELMIVTVIVGILAAMATVAFDRTRESAFASVVVSDIRQLPVVVESHLAEHGELPRDVAELKEAGFRTSENVCVTEYEADQETDSVELRLRYRGHDVFSSWDYPEEGAPEAPDQGPPPWSNGNRGCLDDS